MLTDGREVVLRRAALADAEAIWQLYNAVYQGNYTLPIVNLRSHREQALQDPGTWWLVDEDEEGRLVGSVIFQVDLRERCAKVFAAVSEPEFRRGQMMYLTLEAGIEAIMNRERLVDVVYATTRTRTMGPNNLLHKLGFESMGIFPNVHRLAEYETHGLKARFHPEAFEKRKRLPKLIPEVQAFYDITRKAYGLEPAEIAKVPGGLKLEIKTGPEVAEAHAKAREAGTLLLDYFPFHEPTHLFTSETGHVQAFINREGKDGHGVLVALKAVRDSVQHLEHLFDVVFETGRSIRIDYMELLISAYQPKHQRAAMAAEYLPCAYFPAMRQGPSGREDYVVFGRSRQPLDFSHVQLTPRDRHFLDAYLLNTEFRHLVVQMHDEALSE